MFSLSYDRATPAMRAWAVELRDDKSFQVGMPPRRKFIDGVEVEGRAEIHNNGTPQNPAPHPHRGIGLYYAGEPDPTRAEGVDVSGHQRDPVTGKSIINWKKVRESGVRFAILKATEGQTFDDELFDDHWLGAAGEGLLVGAYHFFRIRKTPKEQTDNYLDRCLQIDPNAFSRPHFPPILDVEWQKSTKALDGAEPEAFADSVEETLEILAKATKRRPMLYTAPGFWSLMPQRPSIVAAADLWIAHYGVKDAAPFGGWPQWAVWQYSASKNVPGAGPIDANVFRGPWEALIDYLNHGKLPDAVLSVTTPRGLQAALNLLGANPRLVEDGIFGPKTTGAVRMFQRSAGLTPDGIVGPLTLAALKKALAALS